MTIPREVGQMALEALETLQSDIEWQYQSPTRKMLRKVEEALRAALAAKEPEPHGYLWFTQHMEQRFTHRQPKEDERIGDVKPVYTAPPQREWQGLTEKEHEQIAIDCGCASADWVFYGAAVERKVKEKNT